jgi:UDP-N-acetylmuramoyl-L-alanyl-D-glutamate--2,6-diaminopimelate ligase
MTEFRTLDEIFRDLQVRLPPGIGDVSITGVVSDSRKVIPGSLFVAVKGNNFDGHRFISDAVKKGAAAIVGVEADQNPGVLYIRVKDSRLILPLLAASFYGNPGHHLTMIGVTGTDGKTTTTNLIYQILKSAGYRAGMISTVNAVIGEQILDTGFHVTTPEAVDVQRYLSMMVDAGTTHAVIETTSHGWAQHRVDGCEFDVGVVTNITHEHLDEHGSLENYRLAKARLFSSLTSTKPKTRGNPRMAVLNRDDSSYDFLSQYCSQLEGINILTYGLSANAQVFARRINYGSSGISIEVSFADRLIKIDSRLVGEFNVYNILAAYSATVGGIGVDPNAARDGIAAVTGIPGRMEAVNLSQDFSVIVDFAHTPNALFKALEAARKMTRGKVIVIFGSAGLRDRQKRRMMAETAIDLADYVVLTAEDPRTESLDAILIEMKSGAIAKGGIENKTFWCVPDRGEAIRKGISLASPGDIVMICGKGHEQSMCFGQVEYAWDDRVAAKAALAEYLGIPGPKMPYLPTQDHGTAGSFVRGCESGF